MTFLQNANGIDSIVEVEPHVCVIVGFCWVRGQDLFDNFVDFQYVLAKSAKGLPDESPDK